MIGELFGSSANFFAAVWVIVTVGIGLSCLRVDKKAKTITESPLYGVKMILMVYVFDIFNTILFAIERCGNIAHQRGIIMAILSVIGYFLAYQVVLLSILAMMIVIVEQHHEQVHPDYVRIESE